MKRKRHQHQIITNAPLSAHTPLVHMSAAVVPAFGQMRLLHPLQNAPHKEHRFPQYLPKNHCTPL